MNSTEEEESDFLSGVIIYTGKVLVTITLEERLAVHPPDSDQPAGAGVYSGPSRMEIMKPGYLGIGDGLLSSSLGFPAAHLRMLSTNGNYVLGASYMQVVSMVFCAYYLTLISYQNCDVHSTPIPT